MNFGRRVRERFHTPYEQYRGFNGRRFKILRKVSKPDKLHDAEVLPMYEIKFRDGTKIEAWSEEIFRR
jgi:hypothetical protein